MVTLTLTPEQVMELVKQLPPEQEGVLLDYLLERRRAAWADLSRSLQPRIRELAAERDRDWGAMTDQEREDFVDDLLHEDKECA
jgi:hypothetical protein